MALRSSMVEHLTITLLKMKELSYRTVFTSLLMAALE